MFSNLMELIDKGGWVMLALLPLSIYVFAVILFKAIQFVTSPLSAQDKLVEQVVADVSSGKVHLAVKTTEGKIGPVARCLETLLKLKFIAGIDDSLVEAEINRVCNDQIKKYRSHVTGLEMASNVAPLLGLLGTVTGMVKAFAVIQSAGSKVDPSLLAGGIWEAMISTVVGLAVAIPALAMQYFVESRIDRIQQQIESSFARVLVAGELSNRK